MNLLTVSTDLISIFLFTTLFLFFARKVAKKVGLVDKPNFRKRHQGLIPLVGGISVYAGICFTFGIVDYYIPHASLYLACAGVLVFIGAVDDRFDQRKNPCHHTGRCWHCYDGVRQTLSQ